MVYLEEGDLRGLTSNVEVELFPGAEAVSAYTSRMTGPFQAVVPYHPSIPHTLSWEKTLTVVASPELLPQALFCYNGTEILTLDSQRHVIDAIGTILFWLTEEDASRVTLYRGDNRFSEVDTEPYSITIGKTVSVFSNHLLRYVNLLPRKRKTPSTEENWMEIKIHSDWEERAWLAGENRNFSLREQEHYVVLDVPYLGESTPPHLTKGLSTVDRLVTRLMEKYEGAIVYMCDYEIIHKTVKTSGDYPTHLICFDGYELDCCRANYPDVPVYYVSHIHSPEYVWMVECGEEVLSLEEV